jgi:NAD-dependent dihydropyrimidine dehydrogenase PreA subunit
VSKKENEEPARGTGAPRQWTYPTADEHPGENIYIHMKWCKSCGICSAMCPRGVLTSDKAGRPIVSNPDACTACGLCEILCPDMAITVHGKPGGRKAASEEKGSEDTSGGQDDE